MTKPAREHEPQAPSDPRWLMPAGVAVLLLGLAISVYSIARGEKSGIDFPVLYEMGRGIAFGIDVYSTFDAKYYKEQYDVSQFGMFYPPSTGVAILPLALLPYPAARLVFTVLTLFTVVFGVRELFRIRPGAVSQAGWYVAAAIVLASAAMRWGAILLQVAPLVLGLLCWFVGALHRDRPKLAVAIAVFSLCLKMTLALPFLGLLAVYRRFGAAFAAVGIWIGVNALGFLRLGPDSFRGYRDNIAILEDIAHISSPDPWRPIALPRLDWVSLVYGVTENLTLSRVLNLVFAAVFALWLLREWLRSPKTLDPRTTALFLPPLVCLGLCVVYHHQYDAVSFFAPAFVVWIFLERRITPAVVLSAPLLLMIVALPIGKAQALLEQWFGLFGVGLLKLSFPIACTLALIGGMLNLSSRALEPQKSRET
jgi:hypothetical protein